MAVIYYLGFSGSRHGITDIQRDKLSQHVDHLTHHFDGVGEVIGRHGNCIEGDEEFDAICVAQGVATECLPSNWESTQSKKTAAKVLGTPPWPPPFKRNSNIIKIIDELVACPRGSVEEDNSRGTWDAVAKARERGLKVTVILPDGTITDGSTI